MPPVLPFPTPRHRSCLPGVNRGGRNVACRGRSINRFVEADMVRSFLAIVALAAVLLGPAPQRAQAASPPAAAYTGVRIRSHRLMPTG